MSLESVVTKITNTVEKLKEVYVDKHGKRG